MASKIFTGDLKIGMFVADLDRPWVDTPFLLQGFLIENEEQVLALKTHCECVISSSARSTGSDTEAVAGIYLCDQHHARLCAGPRAPS